METMPLPPRSSANPAPVRVPGSIRRTTTIDVSWPDGPEGDRAFSGRARDFLTPFDDAKGIELASASFEARLDSEKEIKQIAAIPAPEQLQRLVGERGGGHLRLVLQDLMPEQIAGGALLYLLLDDISGVALVSTWAWAQWDPDWAAHVREKMPKAQLEKMQASREGVCWGLQPGNSGTDWDAPRNVADADAKELRNPADPDGWHLFPEAQGPGFRRGRRIDVTHDENRDILRVEAAFQDSSPRPDGSRIAIHEYRLSAEIDASSHEILTLTPEARILPFYECPGAIANTQRLIGSRIDQIRDEVLQNLRGPAGCTHLNDALRALAEVPLLARHLDKVPQVS